MSYRELFKEENSRIRERYELACGRIQEILKEHTVKPPYDAFFQKTAGFICMIMDLAGKIENGSADCLDFEASAALNRKLYEDILPENYSVSFANPAFAAEQFGEGMGQVLSFLYTEIRGMIVYAYECRFFDMTICMELFIEIYNYFEAEAPADLKAVKDAVYWFISDYCDVTLEYRVREQLDTSLDFIRHIVMDSDFNDLRYLYKYGEYISENELMTAKHLNKMPQEAIDKMAATYVDGYIRGFKVMNVDLSAKELVEIRYHIGFERIVRSAVSMFEHHGLKPVMYRSAANSINKRAVKTGVISSSPNRQYDYDHRFDAALYLDKAFNERRLSALRVAYEHYREQAFLYAGPAIMDVFGEEPFVPEIKAACLKLSAKQQKLITEFTNMSAMLRDEFIRMASTSFTIIAYPLPEIGTDYPDIFDETVRINTLDNALYTKMQAAIIDVLDRAAYVRVKGSGGNRTDMTVRLIELRDPDRQSKFENCVADVNIPAGEVFTTPELHGTEGVLHVKSVYLNDLLFKDLELHFKDGMIEAYSCANFSDENENKKYICDNVLFNHETLPIGEFAIGTNTAAYVMAEKFGIVHKLPILIVEKMGPHFAVGDTCYRKSEDTMIYNPDGKEIAARENDFSLLRKTDPEKAYFNCHTDITIPYDEIGEISAVRADGTAEKIIENGRFVLKGCEALNLPFDK